MLVLVYHTDGLAPGATRSGLDPYPLKQLTHMPIAIRELVQMHADFVQQRQMQIVSGGRTRDAAALPRRIGEVPDVSLLDPRGRGT
jgi:hypothetical protein